MGMIHMEVNKAHQREYDESTLHSVVLLMHGKNQDSGEMVALLTYEVIMI